MTMTTVPSVTDADLTTLREVFRGEVILPTDAAYDQARTIVYFNTDKYPALVVRPLDADDVATAVKFGKEKGLAIAIKGSGHSNSGYGTVDDGIVIDLSRMRAITIDADARIAHAEAGILTGEYVATASQYDLITPFGDSPGVSVAGITIGGGIGYFSRKLGLTIDSLMAAEMVTADGEKIRVSESEHPDLFWAIRGGSGNFGVVTSVYLKLHPLGQILGGALYLPATREVIRGVLDLTLNGPEDLTTISMLMVAPDTEDLPETLHNQLCFMVTPVWAGELEAGQRELDKFRALATPLADQIRPMFFSDVYAMNDLGDMRYTEAVRTFFATDLDDTAIDALIDSMQHPPAPPSSAIHQLRVFGGAMARVPQEATAFAHRNANFMVGMGVVAFEALPPEQVEANEQWVDALYQKTAHIATGAYVNFLNANEEGGIAAAYPPNTYRRLTEIKRRYDPENRFHINQNIPPATD